MKDLVLSCYVDSTSSRKRYGYIHRDDLQQYQQEIQNWAQMCKSFQLEAQRSCASYHQQTPEESASGYTHHSIGGITQPIMNQDIPVDMERLAQTAIRIILDGEVAGFWRRALAEIIDLLLISLLCLTGVWLFGELDIPTLFDRGLIEQIYLDPETYFLKLSSFTIIKQILFHWVSDDPPTAPFGTYPALQTMAFLCLYSIYQLVCTVWKGYTIGKWALRIRIFYLGRLADGKIDLVVAIKRLVAKILIAVFAPFAILIALLANINPFMAQDNFSNCIVLRRR
eukprot:gene5020-8749_t